MRQVGHRREPEALPETDGAALAGAVEFSANLTRLAGGRVMFPKGVFRYKTHGEANAHQEACLAVGMAQLAMERKHGRNGTGRDA